MNNVPQSFVDKDVQPSGIPLVHSRMFVRPGNASGRKGRCCGIPSDDPTATLKPWIDAVIVSLAPLARPWHRKRRNKKKMLDSGGTNGLKGCLFLLLCSLSLAVGLLASGSFVLVENEMPFLLLGLDRESVHASPNLRLLRTISLY